MLYLLKRLLLIILAVLAMYFAITFISHWRSGLVWKFRASDDFIYNYQAYRDRVFVSDGVETYALDHKTGRLLWRFPIRTAWIPYAFEGNHVFIAEDFTDHSGRLVKLDIRNGRRIWSKKAKKGVGRFLIAHDNQVYLENSYMQLQAHDIKSGKLMWVTKKGRKSEGKIYVEGFHKNLVIVFDRAKKLVIALKKSSGDLVWEFQATGVGAYYGLGGNVYALRSDSLYALDAISGKTIWQSKIPALAKRYPPTIRAANRRFVLIGGNRPVILVDAKTGRVLWQKDDQRTIRTTKKLALVLSEKGTSALDVQKGKIAWEAKSLYPVDAAISKKYVSIVTQERYEDFSRLMVLGADNGSIIKTFDYSISFWAHERGLGEVWPPVNHKNIVFVSSGNNLYAVRATD